MSSFSVLTPSNCFANLIKEFQILLEAQNSPDNTVRNYMTYISDFLSWVNDIKHIDDLDHVFWSDLREYQIFLRESRNLNWRIQSLFYSWKNPNIQKSLNIYI